jgi:hypothetical protein
MCRTEKGYRTFRCAAAKLLVSIETRLVSTSIKQVERKTKAAHVQEAKSQPRLAIVIQKRRCLASSRSTHDSFSLDKFADEILRSDRVALADGQVGDFAGVRCRDDHFLFMSLALSRH